MTEHAGPDTPGESPSPEVSRFSHVSELLLEVARQAAVLDAEAERKILREGDSTAYEDATRERARLIAALPTILAKFEASGGEVPPEVAGLAEAWSSMAKLYQENDSLFGMSVLLIAHGARDGEPNALELLATQHQPPIETTE